MIPKQSIVLHRSFSFASTGNSYFRFVTFRSGHCVDDGWLP